MSDWICPECKDGNCKDCVGVPCHCPCELAESACSETAHIKCDPARSDDDSDEIVVHRIGAELFVEIYQGPGLGTRHTQTLLTADAARTLREFLNAKLNGHD